MAQLRELREYLRREILNVALRNTDNHGRNGALLKYPDGTVMLSPLYDFAPMFLDSEGIPRSSRWGKELEPMPGRPDWGRVAENFLPQVAPQETRAFLAGHSEKVAKLPDTVRQCRVEEEVIEGVAGKVLKIYPRVLMENEKDRGNPTLETLKKIARPYGLKVGFVRRSGSDTVLSGE